MLPRPVPFIDPMTAIRIRHELKDFIIADQRIEQLLGIFIVYIVISRPMDIQQIAPQIPGIGNRRTGLEILPVLLWQPHIPLLVKIVIGQLVANSCNGDPRFIDLGVLEK